MNGEATTINPFSTTRMIRQRKKTNKAVFKTRKEDLMYFKEELKNLEDKLRLEYETKESTIRSEYESKIKSLSEKLSNTEQERDSIKREWVKFKELLTDMEVMKEHMEKMNKRFYEQFIKAFKGSMTRFYQGNLDEIEEMDKLINRAAKQVGKVRELEQT